jgi:hypothetical protein
MQHCSTHYIALTHACHVCGIYCRVASFIRMRTQSVLNPGGNASHDAWVLDHVLGSLSWLHGHLPTGAAAGLGLRDLVHCCRDGQRGGPRHACRSHGAPCHAYLPCRWLLTPSILGDAAQAGALADWSSLVVSDARLQWSGLFRQLRDQGLIYGKQVGAGNVCTNPALPHGMLGPSRASSAAGPAADRGVRAYLYVRSHAQVVALPLQSFTYNLFYRLDMFERLGIPVPRTWRELVATAEKYNGTSDGRTSLHGFCGSCGWRDRGHMGVQGAAVRSAARCACSTTRAATTCTWHEEAS